MKFIKVKATQKTLGEVEFFLNSDLIKIIGTDGTVYLKNDPNDTVNENLFIGDKEYVSIRIDEDINLDTKFL